VGKMPTDALFEVVAGCVKQIEFRPGAASESARFGSPPLREKAQEGGLKRPLQRPDRCSGPVGVSTTEFLQFVVENRGEKSALKVIVEAFLLGFCTKCRRADIFHRNGNLPASGGDLIANSTREPTFSAVFCSGRLPRRAPFHQFKSK